MLTLLYLIHQWFYSSPKERPPHNSTESKERAKFQIEIGVPTSVDPFRKSNCQSEFCTHFALRKVYKVSATIVVEEVQTPREPLKYLEMSIEEKFRAAVRVIHSLPKDGPYQPSNSTKLKFYGLYKQSTEGKNTTPKPGFWDVIGRAKWESWNKLGDMSKDGAMNQYVDCLKEIVETMSFNGDVEDFLDSIGPFYEFVTLQGSEMNHIKEKIEEFSSSNGSSLANSIVPSVENSKENSPAKSLQNGNEEEEEEVSTSEKAEVIIGTNSATYEHHKKSHNSQNGDAFKMTNGDEDDPQIHNVPPPAPRHSYSNQNGHVKNAFLPNDNDDEVLTVSTSYNVSCKEDLEREAEEVCRDHPKTKLTSSIDTVATSGTESEKYYSGDSDPEMEEKFANSMFIANNYPSTSAAALAQDKPHQFVTSQLVHTASDGSHNLRKSMNNPNKKSFKGYISPKSSTALMTAADVATQQTIERLNRDVDHILARLRILEAAYAASAEGAMRLSPNQSESGRRKRRILGDLSTQSIAFIVMWPFAVQFLIKLIRWWWRRRRNLRAITN